MKLWKLSVVLLAVAAFAMPVNAQDTCASAIPAPGPVDPCADTAPDDEGLAGPSSCAGGALDTWLTFVATSTSHRIRTDIGSAGTDSEVGIYSGSCGALVEVNCNNDECFNGVNFCPSEVCDGDAAGPWMSSACTGGLTPGATYYLRVTTFGDYCPNGPYVVTIEGDGGTCGDGVLACDGSEECETDANCPNGGVCNGCVCEAPCPSTCETAVDTGSPSNCGAGAAVGETFVDPCCDTDPTGPLPGACIGSGGENDVWLTFVATEAATRVRTNLNSQGTDSAYMVYSGSCGSLVEVGCSEDEGGGPWLGDINIFTTIGETYYVQLGSFADTCTGLYGVTISGIPGATCGDNIRSQFVGEGCDGTDSVNCEGLCLPPGDANECQCPEPVCGNGVREEGEQCDLGAGNGASGCLPADCDCTADCKLPSDIVPAVSEWGLVVMVLIGLAAGTVMFGRKRVATA